MVLPKWGKKNCDKLIVAMPLPKQGGKKKLWQSNCGNGIAEIRRKKNCENLTVAMPLQKQGNKKKMLAIVAMELPKMGGKKIK